MPTNTELVWNNGSPHWEEKPIWGGGGPPSVGHQRVKICQLSDLVNFVHFSNQLKFTQKNVNLLNFTRNKQCVNSFWFHFNFEVVWGRVKTTFCRPIHVKRRQSQRLTMEEPKDNYHKLSFCKFQVVSGESLMNKKVYRWLTGLGP